ncbi:MAG: hypothetical protein ACREOZ_02225 [Gloeomargaritales cyanobacterium]
MVHSIEVEPLLGQFSQGPSYGTKVVIDKCFVEDETTLQRDKNGQEVVSSCMVLINDLTTDIPLDSRVTVNGRRTTVLNVKRRDGGGLPTPDHLEVILR